MEIKELVVNRKRDFSVSVSLVGVIPLLVCVYLMAVKIASLQIFVGEIGYIMFLTILVFLLGMVSGKRMLESMLREIIEKNRLAAITETTLALSHEINNPLFAMSGNLELLEGDFLESQLPDNMKSRLNTIKTNCERIRKVTEKLANLSKPVSTTIAGNSKMIDLSKSC